MHVCACFPRLPESCCVLRSRRGPYGHGSSDSKISCLHPTGRSTIHSNRTFLTCRAQLRQSKHDGRCTGKQRSSRVPQTFQTTTCTLHEQSRSQTHVRLCVPILTLEAWGGRLHQNGATKNWRWRSAPPSVGEYHVANGLAPRSVATRRLVSNWGSGSGAGAG